MREKELRHLVDTRVAQDPATADREGFVIGRSLLFPPGDNVAAAVDAVVEML